MKKLIPALAVVAFASSALAQVFDWDRPPKVIHRLIVTGEDAEVIYKKMKRKEYRDINGNHWKQGRSGQLTCHRRLIAPEYFCELSIDQSGSILGGEKDDFWKREG